MPGTEAAAAAPPVINTQPAVIQPATSAVGDDDLAPFPLPDEATIKERPGYLYCQAISEIFNFEGIKLQAVPAPTLHQPVDHARPFRLILRGLKGKLEELERRMLDEERLREMAKIDEGVPDETDAGELERQRINDEKQAAEKKFGVDKELLAQAQSAKHQEILRIDSDKASAAREEKIRQEQDLALKEHQQALLRERLEQTSCKCWPCVGKETKEKLNTNINKVLELKIPLPDPAPSLRKQQLETEIADINEKILALISNHHKHIMQLDAAMFVAMRKRDSGKVKVEGFKESYNSEISRQNMLSYLCVHANFLSLVEHIKAHKTEDHVAKQFIIRFLQKLSEIQHKATSLFNNLTCPEANDIIGEKVWDLFNHIEEPDKNQFIATGELHQKLTDWLLPLKAGKRAGELRKGHVAVMPMLPPTASHLAPRQ